jgi:acetyl/propionyl-CoA carboxylase alpha subunit
MGFIAVLDGRESEIGIAQRRPGLVLAIDGRAVDIAELPAEDGAFNLLPAEDGAFNLLIDGTPRRGWRYRIGNELHLRLGGRSYVLEVLDRHAGGKGGAGSGNELRAEMPGTIVEIACQPGAQVAAGQALLTIESMKMQMILSAPFDAMVETVHVAPNASFERAALLVTLKPV